MTTKTQTQKFQILRNGELVSPVVKETEIKGLLDELEKGEARLVELGWIKTASRHIVTTTTKRLGSW